VSAVESSRIVGTATILADRDCTAGPEGLVLVITVLAITVLAITVLLITVLLTAVLVITGLVITVRRAAG
jgi:hypothetical protein